MARLLLHLPVAGLLFVCAFAKVPPYIKICGRHDPNLDECVKESVNKLKPKLATGIPDLLVPSTEPLHVGKVILAQLQDFEAIANDVMLGGLSVFEIKELKTNLDQQKIFFKLNFPKVHLKSDLNVNAKISVLTVKDQGPIDMIAVDVDAEVSLVFEKKMHKGREYMFFPRIQMKLTVPNYTADYGILPTDNAITQAINSVLKSNKQDIIESMIPSLEKAISSKVLLIGNQICRHFSYDELFPDST